jgi:predicted amidohydrolase YtcJ
MTGRRSPSFQRLATLILMMSVTACSEEPAVDELVSPQVATVLIQGGTIYTNTDDQPTAGVLAISMAGTVMAIGQTREEVEHLFIGDPTIIDLQGGVAFPGFADSHMHLQSVGERELTLNLEGVSGIPELQQRLADRIALAEPGEWIIGRGWIETHWEPPEFPTRYDLDAVSPDHPVILERADGHAVVANSRALAAGAVVADRPDPFGGAILRDADGVPTGMLVDNAISLVDRMIPPSSEIPVARALDAGITRSLSLGLTTLHVAGSYMDVTEELLRRCQSDELPIRIVDAVFVEPDEIDEVLAFVDANRAGCADRLQINAIKVQVDGALGSRGAALLAPYADADTDGLLMWEEADLDRLFAAAAAAEIQIWTHAIGDRANRWVLDRYEIALEGREDHRWRIEHVQNLAVEDLPRFAELGVIPSMQASHAIGDLYFAPRRLGQERLAGAYAWRDLVDSGVVIAGGSDAPVEVGDPRIEFYAAVARADLNGFQGDGWHPEQALSREEALAMLTTWSAYSVFQDGQVGCLGLGCRADLTVLAGDLMTLPLAEIPTTPVIMTIVGGEVVWARDER